MRASECDSMSEIRVQGLGFRIMFPQHCLGPAVTCEVSSAGLSHVLHLETVASGIVDPEGTDAFVMPTRYRISYITPACALSDVV